MENDVLTQLYQRYAAATLLYCLTLCGDKAQAEDLMSDAFVKAYLTLPKEVPNFSFWLLCVCKNLWLDHLRKQKHLSQNRAKAGRGIPVEMSSPDTAYYETVLDFIEENGIYTYGCFLTTSPKTLL